MKNTILLSLLIGFSFVLRSQKNSLLWEVSGNGLKQSSYLYGTFHSKDYRAHQFGDSVLLKLAEADIGIFEYIENLEKDKSAMVKRVIMKDTKLEDLISQKDFKFVQEQVMTKIGYAGMFFNKMTPLITSVMAVEIAARNEMPFTVDNFLKEEFKKSGEKVIGLETIDEAMAAIDNISLKEQAKMLVEFFREYEEQFKMNDSLILLYQKEDIMAMHDFYKNLDDVPLSFDKGLILDRNKKFVDGLIPYLMDNSVFCAVGALHLPGETGLIQSLQSKGYKVTPVFSEHTLSYLTIGRKKDWGYFNNDSLKMIMHFPEDPYYDFITLSNQDSSKTLELTHYFLTDSINDISYSVEAGKIGLWSVDEIVNTIMVQNKLQKISEKKELLDGKETTVIEFYVSSGVNIRYHILTKNKIVYILSVKGSKQKIYADLAEYFFRGMSYNSITEFQELLDNENNITLDIMGSVLYENRDTANTYQVYTIIEGDTSYFDYENETKFAISLNLGYKYILGFKKEGYQRKHLIVDVVEHGTIQDCKYGFDFPMRLTLIKGEENGPSQHVATIKYNPFTGYMDY